MLIIYSKGKKEGKEGKEGKERGYWCTCVHEYQKGMYEFVRVPPQQAKRSGRHEYQKGEYE